MRQPDFERVRLNAQGYLFQTATNLARDIFRQRVAKGAAAEAAAFAAAGLETPDWSSWPELALEGQQLSALIVDTLQALDPRVRCALLLHRFRDLTHGQIAACMRLSERTIERYIQEGLQRIADRMEECL